MHADPRTASLAAWLRANGAPALVPNRTWRHAISATIAGPFLLIGYLLRSLLQTVLRRSSSMLQIVPLLLVALTLSFFSTEVWQTIGRLHGLPLVLTTLLFVLLALAFLMRETRPDLDALAEFADLDTLREALPARLARAPLDMREAGPLPLQAPVLRRRERLNLLVIAVLSQVVVAAVIALVVAAFFIVLGVIAVDRGAIVSWLGHNPQVVVSWRVVGHEYLLSNELLRVSAFLGAFTGFYFIVSSSTDQMMRADLTAGHRQHVRACLAVRYLYWTSGRS